MSGCQESAPDAGPSNRVEPQTKAQAAAPAGGPGTNAYFGDLHVHTSYSLDAFQNGNRIPPRDAYRFALGEVITLPGGIEAQLDQPLDFAALTDHAEGLDVVAICTDPEDPQYTSKACAGFRNPSGLDYFRGAFARGINRPAERYPGVCDDPDVCRHAALGPWQDLQAAAQEFYEPGRFTTFIGFEFSPLLPNFGMLHRNVLFRGRDVVERAISSTDVRDTADFFAQLDAACQAPCRAITIPHNSNFSWGLTFSRSDENGDVYTDVDLERRARFDRLVEIFQQKGASECAMGVGTTDEACGYEQIFPVCDKETDTRCAEAGSFARNGLKRGLAMEAEGGVNPFKQGFIGSTDTHTTDPGNTRPAARFVQTQGSERAARSLLQAEHPVIGPMRMTNPGGLAGVWAASNTREDLFDALVRRETFATSGTRLRVRFFGGYGLPEDLAERQDPTAAAYARGVPMGGDLSLDAMGRAPRFWVWAARAPDGAALDRIEVVKGSYDGTMQERVWDVACAGGRQPGAESGRCPPTPSRVDPVTCETHDPAGAGELQALFSDPEFDPAARAFYYVKVYESPTCRWTTLLARKAGLEPLDDVPQVVQERAWSSPLWYSPVPAGS